MSGHNMAKKSSVTETEEKKQEKERKSEGPLIPKRGGKKVVRDVIVDMWKTGLHREEIGIKKQEEYRAKSRQFTADMDLIGEIKEEKKQIGHIGIRESIWKVPLLERRLVLKLFSDKLNWQGTIEERLSQEYQMSFGGRHNFPCFSVILDDYDYVINIDKVRGGWLHPEWFIFSFIHKDATIEQFVIKAKLGLGDDFRVVSTYNPKATIAILDGKKFDIGGQWDIKIYDPELAKNRFFVRTLILFAATIRYHKTLYKKVKKILSLMNKGKFIGKLPPEELDLLKNPRLRRR